MEIASLYSSMNDYKNELKYTEKCIKLLKKYVITDIEIAALYHNQVLALIEQGLYKDCESILNKAIESKPKVLHHTYNAFTNLYTHLNRFQEAQDYATRVLALRRESFGSYHPQTAVALNNLGLCCYYSGNINQGINFIQESLIIREKILGRDNELTLQTRVNIAGILKNSDINSAEEQINLALLLMTKKSPLMSSALEVKGMILNNTGRIELAVDCFQKSLVLNRVFHGDIHPYTKISYRELGKIFLKMKKIQKAKIYFKKALNIDIKIYGQEDVNTAMSLNNLGNVFQENNEIKKALINFEKAHTIFLNALGLEHEHTKLLAKKLNELNDI
jgi:tetratricopeptide (TPR) repeat protein